MAVKRIGSLLKLDAIEQPLNITCYGVGCHNKRGIKGVDVFARNRTFGMSNQRCNSDLREPQIVRKACEAVSQDRKSTRLNSRPTAHIVCRLLLEQKKKTIIQ